MENLLNFIPSIITFLLLPYITKIQKPNSLTFNSLKLTSLCLYAKLNYAYIVILEGQSKFKLIYIGRPKFECILF